MTKDLKEARGYKRCSVCGAIKACAIVSRKTMCKDCAKDFASLIRRKWKAMER